MINGDIAFIGASAENHGLTAKIANSSHIHEPNLITVSYNGSVGEAFYQTDKFWASDDINVLYPKFNQNKNIALFMCSCLRKRGNGYEYNFKWSKELMESDYISLPITPSGFIDFDYMETYIREIEDNRLAEMNEFIQSLGLGDCELTNDEIDALSVKKSKQHRSFKIGELYDKVELQKKKFDKRKDTRQSPDLKYFVPLVNAKHGNNGIMYYGDPNVFDSVDMTIDIVQNGAVATGDVYPQPQFTGVLWDAYLIRALNHKDSVETLMYFSAVIEKTIKKKYTYDNKAYWELIKNEKVSLPVTSSGEIDFTFMETYIRALEKLAIGKILDWEVTDDMPKQIDINEIAENQRYTTHLPLYPLRAACGYFDESGSLPEEEAEGWIDVSSYIGKLNKGMFVVHAEGNSMEPKIHDGDLCVFDSTGAGSRQGKIVLIKAQDKNDPAASSFTIKQYSSEKSTDDDGNWHHTRIVLSPLNHDFQPIIIDAADVSEDDFHVYGELVTVLGR